MSNPHIGEEDDFAAEREMLSLDPDASCDPAARVMRSLAAVGTIFGTAGIVLLPLGIIRLHEGNIFGDASVAILDGPVRGTSIDALWLAFSSVFGAGLAGILLAGSVGALSLRKWARPLLMAWALGSIPIVVSGIFFEGRWLLPPWRSHLAQVRGVVDALVNFAGWGAGSALVVAMLLLLNHPKVKAAFVTRKE